MSAEMEKVDYDARLHAVYAAGRQLSEVNVTGVDGYTFTGRILAWGAEQAAAGGLRGTGAMGPADAYGLDALVDGCRQSGISEKGDSGSEQVRAPDHAAAG